MELNLKILDESDLPDHSDEAFDLFDPATLQPDEPDDDDDDDFIGDDDTGTPKDGSATTSASSDGGATRADALAQAAHAPARNGGASVAAGGTPPLRFKGTTMPIQFRGSLPNGLAHTPPDRNIRGTVSMTADGHVHWVSCRAVVCSRVCCGPAEGERQGDTGGVTDQVGYCWLAAIRDQLCGREPVDDAGRAGGRAEEQVWGDRDVVDGGA